MKDGTHLLAVKAREIPRGSVVIGDMVRLTGDLSGRPDTPARIVQVEERRNVLRQSGGGRGGARGEIIVANADLMVIVTLAADPLPGGNGGSVWWRHRRRVCPRW